MSNRLRGWHLMFASVITRLCVLIIIILLASWSIYLNYKVGYNNARLVELADGKLVATFYRMSDWFFSCFGDPVAAMQSNGGMTWSIRLFGVQITDPIAATSVFLNNGQLAFGFFIGALIPLSLALLFGRVFCSYICPASLLFFTIGRLRRLLGRFFYFPELPMNRFFAWGVLCGGVVLALVTTHGIWALILPYFAVGQTIFHAITFGVMHVAVFSILFFIVVDFALGYQFTCRHICPTGRLLGVIGAKPLVSIRRDASACIDDCHSCEQVCTFMVSPKKDETRDCSLCGECMSVCPASCLSVGTKKAIDVSSSGIVVNTDVASEV